jgi:hypothetical protein
MRNINTKQLKIRFFLLVFFLGISVASAFAQVKMMQVTKAPFPESVFRLKVPTLVL